MLSKTSIVICGLLHKERLSAYDMLKKIEERQMKYWLPIGNTTLYETALRLQKKGIIEGEDKEGSKVIYSLTEKGSSILKEDLKTLFFKMDYDTIWFSLVVLFSDVFEKEELLELIKGRKELLKINYRETAKHAAFLKETGVPYQGIATIERMLQVTKLEEKTLSNMEAQLMETNSIKL